MDEDELESDLEDCENGIDDEHEFKKKVEPALCEWIETEGCWQDVVDRYFNNPPHHLCKCHFLFHIHLSHFIVPTHACCDNCDGTAINSNTNAEFISQPEHLSTPVSAHPFPGSAQASPSKSVDANGKQKMVIPKPPSQHTGMHLENANLVLWSGTLSHCYLCTKNFQPSVFTQDFIPLTEMLHSMIGRDL